MSHINSSFSDDGIFPLTNKPYLGRRSQEEKGMSLQVEYSDKGRPPYI